MKVKLADRSNPPDKSLTLQKRCLKNAPGFLHYHPEFELVYISNSSGTRFIGDSIAPFEPDNLVLIGQNLPHLWKNDSQYYQKASKLPPEALEIHFDKAYIGNGCFSLPELHSICDLLEHSKRGICFSKKTSAAIAEEIWKMFDLNDFEKVIALLKILKYLSERDDYQLLSSVGFIQSFVKSKKRRLDYVYEYIENNFREELSLEEVADMAHMNKASFCRYFKKNNKKTFSRYINELRIGYACKLLMEQEFNIAEICYRAGYNNLSNFNRQFKKITHMSPTGYIRKYNFA